MKNTLCMAGLSLVLTASVWAQGSFKDGPYFAYPDGGDVQNGRAGLGWQVAYEWTEFLSAELSATRVKDKLDELSVLPPPYSSTFDLELFSIALGGRLSYPVGPVSLYAGGGIGYYLLRTDSGRVNRSIREHREALPAGVSDLQVSGDIKNSFGYHTTIGAEWRLARHWEIFADYRLIFLDSRITYRHTETRRFPGESPAFSRSTERHTEDFRYDHGLVRVGLHHRF